MILYVDGGCLGECNPSPEGIYWSYGYEDEAGFHPINRRSTSPHFHTSNEAEYIALNDALLWLQTFQITEATIRMDSQLVVRQVTGIYKVREPRLQELWTRTQQLLRELRTAGRKVNLEWVRREENVRRLGH